MKKANTRFFLIYALLVYGLVALAILIYSMQQDQLGLNPWQFPSAARLSFFALMWTIQTLILFWPGVIDLGMYFGKLSKKNYLIYLLMQWLPVLFFYFLRTSQVIPLAINFFYRFLYFLVLGNVLGFIAYLFLRMTRPKA